MSAEDEIAALGRDLHYLGLCNSVHIPTKLYEMGWRKNPRHIIAPQVVSAPIVQQMMQSPMAQIANPNQIIPRAQRWMQ